MPVPMLHVGVQGGHVLVHSNRCATTIGEATTRLAAAMAQADLQYPTTTTCRSLAWSRLLNSDGRSTPCRN
jgi:hypothetical protein